MPLLVAACGGGGSGGGDSGNGPAPVVTLGANPASVASGTAALLSWDATDATDCTASGGWNGSKDTSGSQSTGNLTATTSYTLTCNGAGGTTAETTTVAVTAPGTPTVTFTASPTTVASGNPATLTWSSSNATGCTASGGWSGAKGTSGTQSTGNLTATATYTLTCSGAGGSASRTQTVTVTPPPPPPTVTLSASPTTIASGTASSLTWSSTNATGCTASNGWSGAKGTSGTQSTGNLTVTATYTLTCTGAGGSANRSATVTVTPLPPAPTVSLSANPTTTTSGTASALTWSSTNATGCTASGGWSGSRNTSGTQSTGNLTATTTFTLTCAGAGGSASQSATVTVAPAPTVTLTANPTTIASGATSGLTWSTTNATGCTASGGWSGTKATSGTQSTGNLTTTTTYTLTCTGAGGSANQSATVTVAPAPTVTLTANPTTIASGATSGLSWSSTNATGCTASGGWSGVKSTSGSQSTGNLTSTATFTLTCTGTGGSASDSATVTVTPPAPTVTLTANPTTVTSGTASTLTWSTSGATGCTASGGWSGAKATNGSQSTGNLTATTTFSLGCTGAGGTTNRSATVTVSTGGSSIFPLRVEAGKRYLVTAQGNPFLVQGDAPWLLITNLTKEEAVTYLDDRQAKGYNTLLVELIEKNRSINKPANVYGDPPFAPDPGEFSVPPEDAYFDHAEYIIGQARQRGMLVLLTPAYMGFDGRENHWYPAMGRAGNPLLREYGQYIAARFQDYDNILWVHGGDYNPPDRTRLRAVMDGIQDVETESLHTFHGSRGTSALGWAGTTEPWLDVNNVYADEDTVIAESRIEWERPTTMPYFFIEGDYEDEAANALETRQQAWQAVLSGNAGQVTGQASVWKFEPGVWQTKLNTEGASTLVHLRTLFESYAWWTLVPDFDNTFLTAGAGTGAARAPAALAADGSFAFVYTRDIRDLTVDLGDLDGATVQARWYDPTSGSFATVAGSPFSATGSRVFRPTGANSRGKNDWVLVLEAVN